MAPTCVEAVKAITDLMVAELRLSREARRVSDRDIAYGRARAFSEALEELTSTPANETLTEYETALREWDKP